MRFAINTVDTHSTQRKKHVRSLCLTGPNVKMGHVKINYNDSKKGTLKMPSLLVRRLFVLNFVSTIIVTTVKEVWNSTAKDLFYFTTHTQTAKYNIVSNQIQPPLVTINGHYFEKIPGKCNMSHKV